ncbi:MAG: glycosyltransferase family 2 protein [Sulfuricellaceae bacterium]|nr:glycosyltransferase family 2 protein [Sulfuricellaceae bacterium]
MNARIHLSVVSHGQGALVRELLADLARYCQAESLEVVLTLNLPERLPFSPAEFPFPLRVVENGRPQGFGANHNAAFAGSAGEEECFVVANPDVRLKNNPFPALLACLRDEPEAGVLAPRVCNGAGRVENSARALPTPVAILAKALGLEQRNAYLEERDCVPVDWVAGMFMLFPVESFAAVGGFDERYRLYYEDVDICSRLWLAGRPVRLVGEAEIVHDARRDSHRKPKYLAWHLASMMRFFLSPVFFRRRRQIHELSDN